ncbi:MAG: tRNA preQ1(34) S-adenosylmethionine ribosyltransferase-isomerase QueA [Verrucomicrobia bacterium]|nr:tRNA preQ1(34) S-adenosylmethionine ribosyltransferase-isomerase QueA [Verrucomicrobiota bacterium]
MKTSDFDYHLPPELIAQQPASERAQARMMVIQRATGVFDHRRVADLPVFLRPGDLLVVNDTRVIPARLYGHKTVPVMGQSTVGGSEMARPRGTRGRRKVYHAKGVVAPYVGPQLAEAIGIDAHHPSTAPLPVSGGRVEILLIEETAPGIWDALLRARHSKPGTRLELAGGQVQAEVLAVKDEGRVTLRLRHERPLLEILETDGVPPLPPYIKRTAANALQRAADRERYQTIYARNPGAVAAPTAGLHFTAALLTTLEQQGVRHAAVTLHVGPGTFKPVTVAEVEQHRMDAERYTVPEVTARLICATREAKGRIVAVGSTVVRTLETVAADHESVVDHGVVVASQGRSDLFIYPPYKFRVVDALLTNFHLPSSSLLMMVSALAGRELILRAYAEAIRERYRFYSYGDCMLIL